MSIMHLASQEDSGLEFRFLFPVSYFHLAARLSWPLIHSNRPRGLRSDRVYSTSSLIYASQNCNPILRDRHNPFGLDSRTSLITSLIPSSPSPLVAISILQDPSDREHSAIWCSGCQSNILRTSRSHIVLEAPVQSSYLPHGSLAN